MCNENRCVEDECKEYQAKIIKFCRKINQAIVPFLSHLQAETQTWGKLL